MTAPKVSLVISDLAGGGAIRAFLLGQVLQQLDYTVEVVGFLNGKDLYAIPPQGLTIKSLPSSPYPGFVGSAWRLINHIDGDIVYAVKPKPSNYGLSLIKRQLSGRPVLLDMDDWEMSWHGGDNWAYQPGSLKQFARDVLKPNGELRNPDHPLYVKWTERFVAAADALTIDTEFLQKRFGGVYIPNGKDTDLFDPSQYNPVKSRETYGLSDYRVLMFPGAPRPHKGVEDVLQAIETLNEPDLRLVIVGGSPYDDYDDRLVERWGQWLIKLPRMPVEQMPAVLAAAHIVVVPQRDTLTARAQFPLKLTDGMAMAKPVLSTRIGDIPTILAGEAGYLVEPNSPQQLAEQIHAIFCNFDEAQQRGLKARAKCVEHYSVHTMARTLNTVLSSLS